MINILDDEILFERTKLRKINKYSKKSQKNLRQEKNKVKKSKRLLLERTKKKSYIRIVF